MKKLLLLLLIALLCFASAAAGAVFGGSNMGYFYPAFSEYLGFDPTRAEVERFVEKAKQYVENCDGDMGRIRDARNDAVREANAAINRYNMGF